MPGFTYYLPETMPATVVAGDLNGGRIRPEILNAFGLAHLHDVTIAGTDAVVSVVRRDGPDGKAGTVIYVRTQEEKHTANLNENYSLKFDSSRQVWSPAISGTFWIGYDKDQPPVAADLVRSSILSGRWVPDASGDRWAIPTARTDGKTFGLLPTSIAFDSAGGLVETLRNADRYIWEIACMIFDRIQAGQSFDDRELLGWAIDVMGANYRFGRTEHRILHDLRSGITDQDFFTAFVVALIDADIYSMFSEEKKTTNRSEQIANT
jgi:hypothetical protein